MKRDDWPVGNEAVRPTGQPDRCFYCNAPSGGQHVSGCVMRQRSVLVRSTVDRVMLVPEQWDVRKIEHYQNAMCGDELIYRLIEMQHRLGQRDDCLCGLVRHEFIREATKGDELTHGLAVAGVPS